MGRIKNIGKIHKKKLKKRRSHGYKSEGVFQKRKVLQEAHEEEMREAM